MSHFARLGIGVYVGHLAHAIHFVGMNQNYAPANDSAAVMGLDRLIERGG